MLKNIDHIFVDCTFIYPNTFAQTIIIVNYVLLIGKKYPLSYIFINNKHYLGYKFALKILKK